MVLATGGTIAGQAAHAGEGVAYQAAQLQVEDLLQHIAGLPELLGSDTLLGEQVAQLNSKDMGFATWQVLVQRCAHWLAQPDVRALVVTHGTDTLEETAFFLQQALAAAPDAAAWRHKPLLLTCAMRPATARLSDGPQNLADAVALARDAHAQGVLVMVAGQVHAADAVQKIHPYRLDAFSSGDVGLLAYVEEGRVRWLRHPPAWPQARIHAHAHAAAGTSVNTDADDEAGAALWQALQNVPPAQWPWVEVLHSHAGANPRALQALAQAGVQGVVLAATGNATVHAALEEAAQQLAAQGVAVRQAPRCSASAVVRSADSVDVVPLAWHARDDGEPSGPRGAAYVLPVSKARVQLLLQLLARKA
ncbi:MAG: asparaginase [Brachymonas sp.]|nr:asparaginase [Brachymonas sp.]